MLGLSCGCDCERSDGQQHFCRYIPWPLQKCLFAFEVKRAPQAQRLIYRHQKIINYTNRKEQGRLFALTVDEGVQARRLLGNRSFVKTLVMTQTKFKRAATVSSRTVSSSVVQGLLPVRVLVTVVITDKDGS